MKKGLILLAIAMNFATLSVTAKEQSPPMDDVQISVPTIKLTATAQMPIEFTITPVAYAMELNVVELNSELFGNNVKPSPLVQMVCFIEAPTTGVDGKAVLSWCTNGYDYANRIPDLGFHYLEGIATEYWC